MGILFVHLSNCFEISSDWLGCLFVCESLDDALLLSIFISNLEFGLVDALICASTKYLWKLEDGFYNFR